MNHEPGGGAVLMLGGCRRHLDRSRMARELWWQSAGGSTSSLEMAACTLCGEARLAS